MLGKAGTAGYITEKEYFIAFPIDRVLDVEQVDALIIRKQPGMLAEEENMYVIPLEN